MPFQSFRGCPLKKSSLEWTQIKCEVICKAVLVSPSGRHVEAREHYSTEREIVGAIQMLYKSLLPNSGLTVTLVELGLSLLIADGGLGLDLGQPLLDGLELVHAGVHNPLFSQIRVYKGQSSIYGLMYQPIPGLGP